MSRPRRSRRRRNRRRTPARRQPRRAPVLRALLALGLCYVVSLNAVVRGWGGGYTSLWSFGHLADKSRAVVALSLHSLRHVLGDPHPPFEQVVRRACARERLPLALARSVARAESGLDPHAISATGAMGLMQLMPLTASEQGALDPFDSAQNVDAGVRYLAELYRRYRGDSARAVAAYNAGPGRVPRRGRVRGLPEETRRYVERVLGPPGAVWLARQ